MPDAVAPTVTLSTGTVAGVRTDHGSRYLGIPYAQPPFGENRFRAPQPVAPWEGVRDASAFGPTAPQSPYRGHIGEVLRSVEIPGDDILTVNVWAPEGAASAPVMVWVHGGALERGSAALDVYDGSAFARDGVVVVSLGYRLGAEGFSVLPDAPRNLGLEDVAAAFAWVRREIAAFGGDPDRITLVGESAGGALVACLLVRPGIAEQVAGAVIESGPLQAQTPERAGRVTTALAKIVGVPATAAALREVPPERLLAARAEQAKGSTPLSGTPGYQLCVDEASLPVSPHEGLRAIATPLVIGTNTDEYRLWFAPEALAAISPLKLRIAALATRTPGRALAAYRAAWPGASAGELLGQIATDRMLRSDAVEVAETRAAPSYVYEFAWESPVAGLRACHALELGFVFDTLDSPDAALMAGDAAPQSLADGMHGDWVRFIVDGEPGWAAFRAGGRVRRYDAETRDVPLPRADALATLRSGRR